jgi:outer membrane biosynthesis protein TonB
MESRFDHYWLPPWPQSKLRMALVISLASHVGLGLLVTQLYQQQTKVKPPVVVQVSFVAAPKPQPPKKTQVASVAKPEQKKATPKNPEPKRPEPKKQPPKKPVVKKSVPKKQAPKKTVAKKLPPKKPTPPKPEPEKPKPKPVAAPAEILVAKKDTTPKAPTVSATEALPSELGSWGRRVQLKVERIWTPPPGIRLGGEEMEAEIEFWVDRNGNLLGEPVVVRHAGNRTLGDSGIQAIKLAGTPRFPPLPATYDKSRQRVVYAFKLAR